MTSDLAIAATDPAAALTPQELARLGQMSGAAGLSGAETVALMSVVEAVASTAAKQATLAMLPAMLGMVVQAHVNAANEIAGRVARQPMAGLLHSGCVQTARQVGQEPPKL